MRRIVIMLAKSKVRSLTYPVSQLLDISKKNVRAEVEHKNEFEEKKVSLIIMNWRLWNMHE